MKGKIVYYGPSYHSTTKSTEFLINYLKEYFEVIVIDGDGGNSGQSADLAFIDGSFLAVIFFQLLPPRRTFKNIKNDNLIYFPMYDASRAAGMSDWIAYKKAKIINFSKKLHVKLSRWGFNSMYIQYFPEPTSFLPGNNDEVFFWQRRSQPNIKTLSTLFSREKIIIHIHKAIDPGQTFQQPPSDIEKQFSITYSDWFETRSEMLNVIKNKAIYIAPRECEGIGMSFLEAMAMGKAVVAVNNPTMNEYIVHGKTGFLYKLNKPRPIDLSEIKQVQRNTYEYMKKGYNNWEKDKHRIIEFIEMPPHKPSFSMLLSIIVRYIKKREPVHA